MSIQTTMNKLKQRGIPTAYGKFLKAQKPPFVIYRGDGQENTSADNTYIFSQQEYQIQYYFKEKNEANEAAIEQLLLEDGWLYEKSSDAYIESENIWVIYYYV